MPSEFRYDVVRRGVVGASRCPVVTQGRVQHVRCLGRALPAVARAALRGGVEECAGGYVVVLVDVFREALGGPAGRGCEGGASVASLLQAHVAPCRARHVQFHPCGWQEFPALHGAGPAVVEGHECALTAADGDGCELGPTVVGVVGPEGEGLGGAAVGEDDAGPAACRVVARLQERLGRAGDPGAGGFGEGWGGEDGGESGG